MARFQTLLLDADNTLFDFSRSEREALTVALKKHALPVTEDIIKTYSEINDRMWKRLERGEISKLQLREARFRELCAVFDWQTDTASLSEGYMEALSRQVFYIEDAVRVCRTLAEHCKLYIVTNGIAAVQRKRFSASLLPLYCERVFISEEIGFEKPAKAYFDAVADKIENFSAAEALVVGDSLTSDIRGGINAGLATCWFAAGKTLPGGAPVPDFTIHRLEELLPLVLG